MGALNDRLIGMLITDDSLARKYLYRELAAAGGTGEAKPRNGEKSISEKTAFSSQSQIELLRGGQAGR
jgi:hypothetical protein